MTPPWKRASLPTVFSVQGRFTDTDTITDTVTDTDTDTDTVTDTVTVTVPANCLCQLPLSTAI